MNKFSVNLFFMQHCRQNACEVHNYGRNAQFFLYSTLVHKNVSYGSKNWSPFSLFLENHLNQPTIY